MQQQQQAAHRKTEEIRQAINNDNMKLAIKLCLKLEKNDTARAMLAFCYNRTGKRDEALEICDSLSQAALYDDHVLHWLGYVYASSRRLDLFAKIRKERLQFAPLKGELFFYAAVDCLFAFAKIYDFKEADLMVKKIMAANRTEARPMMDTLKLSIWAATFGFLRSENDAATDAMALMLSSSYLEKSQTAATAGLPLKRWIQVKRGLYDEALNTLAFLPNESNASKFWMRALLTRLSTKEDKEEQEFNLLCDLVRDAPDDFRAWARLCQLAAVSARFEAELRVLIKEKCALALRGPQLALVRLELELFLAKQSKDDGGRALKCAIVDYVKRFSQLNYVVFSDLQNDLLVFCLQASDAEAAERVELPAKAQVCAYLLPQHEYVQMDRESRRWPVESISARVDAKVREDLFTELKSLCSLQAMQILRYCGAFEAYTVDELMKLAQPLLASTSADEEVLFASALLQDCFTRTGDENLLLLACAILEARMNESKDNFEIKLALHELYSFRLGAPLCGLPAYAMLRIKQIQCDALGHVSLANLSNYGFFEESKQFATSVCEFNARARGECADSFATAFEHCEISSPVEMYRLEIRLRDSLQFHLSLVERAWMNLLPTTVSREVSVLSKLSVEVNSPAQGKSAICAPENRLAVTFANRNKPEVLVWNADLAVEYCCDAPFGTAFMQSLKAATATGPNARIARELLGSKQALQVWRERELKWCELRTSAACALIAAEVKETALVELETLVTDLGLLQQEKQTSLLWRLGMESMRVLVTKKLPDTLFALLGEAELAWREQQVKFSAGWIVQVSNALTNAGMWLFILVSRFIAQAKKKQGGNSSLPFEHVYLTKLQAMSTKLFSRISQNMRELKQSEDKRVFVSSVVDVSKFDLATVHEKVKRSHSESLSRLAALASSLASFD